MTYIRGPYIDKHKKIDNDPYIAIATYVYRKTMTTPIRGRRSTFLKPYMDTYTGSELVLPLIQAHKPTGKYIYTDTGTRMPKHVQDHTHYGPRKSKHVYIQKMVIIK